MTESLPVRSSLADRLRLLVKNWRHNISLAPLNAQVEAKTLTQAADQVDAILKETDALNALKEPTAEAAHSRAPQQEEWQPIETAPKDGTSVLVTGSGLIKIAWWWAGNFQNPAGWLTGNSNVYPTHWRPLPTPPKEPK